jgi:hypothetical protein
VRRGKPETYPFVLPPGEPVPRPGEVLIQEGLYADTIVHVEQVMHHHEKPDHSTVIHVRGEMQTRYHPDIAPGTGYTTPTQATFKRLRIRSHDFAHLQALAKEEGVTVETWIEEHINAAWEARQQAMGQEELPW